MIFLGQFQGFRGILEKSLLEEMCLELKIALKSGLKNVQEAFLPYFNVVFKADSE